MSSLVLLTLRRVHIVVDMSSRCAVCGDSNDVCMCRQCTNCNLLCSGYLSQHCDGHKQCVVCRRSLPAYCYSGNGEQCDTCARKLPQTRSSVSNIVNKVSISVCFIVV